MKKKILVVDDNRMMLSFMVKLLGKNGHEVVTADDGITALDLLTSFTPDIMFIDLIIPRISGDLLCRIVRKMADLKDCYLVILSGAIAEAGCDLDKTGADTYIAKGPFDQMANHILSAVEEAGKPKKDRHSAQILGLDSIHPRQMTRELLIRKRHLEAMLESTSEGILEISSGRIIHANSAAVAITGRSVENLLNLNPLDLFQDSSRLRVEKMLNSKLEAPLQMGLRSPIELNNRLVTLMLVPIDEVPSSNILLLTDVTVRIQMELELRHARKMESIGTIASGVAHNFRNTLAGILANSQIIQINYQNDATLTEIIDRINSSVRRGEQLVNRLLEFSYKEIKKEFKLVDLVSLIQSTDQFMQISFNKQIKVDIKVPDSLYIIGDQSSLSNVLMNLYNNAQQAMKEGGTLSIRAKRKGKKAVITIADTGEGMDSETLEKCFDPFFTTKEVSKGTGLGLSTAYGIVKNHNGHIRVTSQLNKGTVFRIVLPVADSVEMKPVAIPAEKNQPSMFSGSKDQKILVVDDEPSFLKAITQLIETLGFQAASVLSATEAIDVYKTWRPDMVLLDIVMPDMDGITCAKQIISNDPEAAIVIMSGHDINGKFGVKAADRKLFKGYLTKPIGLNDLRQLLG